MVANQKIPAGVGPIKKMQIEKNIFMDKVRAFFKKEDSVATIRLVLDITLSGVLLNLASSLIGMGLSILNVLAFGSAYWFYKNKIHGLVTETIGSLCLVKTYN